MSIKLKIMKYYIGINVGGTKCSISLGRDDNGKLSILKSETFPTIPNAPDTMIEKFCDTAKNIVSENSLTFAEIASIGISCGGPLDSVSGVVQSPPNLPGWNNIEIVKIVEEKLGVKTFIQNDANACALAEWLYGAGVGYKNVVFMTFGTGLGAGVILNGALYAGTNDNAGEVGHFRLDRFGPVGYAKCGSFEGFCSGSGIAQLGKFKAAELLQSGKSCGFCKDASEMDTITAKSIAIAADSGDETAIEVYRTSGEYLGKGLSLIIDILNPELIIIGSIFTRSENLLRPAMQKAIDADALPQAARVCKVVPAKLGEEIGDYAALSVAANGLK